LLIALTLVLDSLLFAPSGAAPAASPAPPAAAATVEPQCPVRVFDVAPIKPDATGAATSYAVSFEVSGDSSGRVDGTVALFSGNTRYDAIFSDAVAAGSFVAKSSDEKPVIVRFQKPVIIDAAYLASIGGDSGGPCAVAFVWLKSGQPAVGRLRGVFNNIESHMRDWASHIEPIEVSAPQSLGAAPCSDPTEPSRATNPAAPPAAATGSTSAFISETSLSETGTVVDAWLWAWVGSHDAPSGADQAALQAAKTAGYTPEVFRCQKVPSVVFVEDDVPASH
jgi:hypothetical protein